MDRKICEPIDAVPGSRFMLNRFGAAIYRQCGDGEADGLIPAATWRMTREEMIARTSKFGVDIVKFCTPLYRRDECREIAKQLLDAGTSVASNYRAACRGRSRAEFIAKLGIANEESDESVGWLTTFRDSGLVDTPELRRLLQEAIELRAIIAASRCTAIINNRKKQGDKRPKTPKRPDG